MEAIAVPPAAGLTAIRSRRGGDSPDVVDVRLVWRQASNAPQSSALTDVVGFSPTIIAMPVDGGVGVRRGTQVQPTDGRQIVQST